MTILLVDLVVLLLISCFHFVSCDSTPSDTLLPGQSISLSAGDTLVSKQSKFEFGFFSPGASGNSYFGIWYKNIPEQTVVWVANRNNPILPPFKNHFIELSDGNLQLLDARKQTLWSTDVVTASTSNNVTRAVLLDSGNFILSNGIEILWQSFDYPTDTWLPGATIGYDKTKNTLRRLTSWLNREDPAAGTYSLQVDQTEINRELVLSGKRKIWRSGPWNRGGFTSFTQGNDLNYAFNFTYIATEDSLYITYNVFGISRIQIDTQGLMKQWFWSDDRQEWILVLFRPTDGCEDYSICGYFGVCDRDASPLCRCLQGYEPRFNSDWSLDDYSSGCVRKDPLQCGSNNEDFVGVQNVKPPASSESVQVGSDQICKYMCSSNCSCNAYAYNSDGKCLLWKGDLFDLQILPNNSRGVEFKIKLFTYHKGKKKPLLVALVASITSAVFVCGTCCYFLWRRKLREKGILRKKKFREMLLSESATNLSKPRTSSNKGKEKKSDIELKFFELHDLKAATNNFSPDNKLGEGGFGHVFKGQLPDGQQIAVKRLSTQSTQGISEFKTEALLIAKLQHRNLVRFLGCCVEDEEKMLIYEYMPNKSLDYFIFDKSRRSSLDWKKRHEIIIGIARGILYLHQDSRLR